MEQEKDNSDQLINNSSNIKIDKLSEGVRCLKALCYKSYKIQQKNYCSNICQILTPLLCLMFTLVVRILAGTIVSSEIKSFQYPQPMDIPIFNSLIPQLNLSCNQLYFYENHDSIQQKETMRIFQNILRRRCPGLNQTAPEFRPIKSIKSQIISILDIADKQAFERGQDLKTQIPDGIITIHNISQNCFNITIGVNDLRLPEYHVNNGVTKITMRHKNGGYAMITAYLKVTEGAMSLTQKLTRSFLMQKFPKQVIVGSYMYMPFNREDRSYMEKVTNILGSALYPLALSLLLPLFLYSIISQKQERLIQIMKMNGLNVKYYWVVVFFFNFLVSMTVYSVFYIFGKYVLEIGLFTGTSYVVIWTLFIGWGISQISLTNFVQIFITDSKSATIVGYVLSIFSTLVGQPLTLFVYPDPQVLPILLIMYPPFALCRGIYLISLACSNDSCFTSLSNLPPQFINCLIVLYGWFFIFVLSIWLNDMVQQDYGVAHRPSIIKFIKNIICFWGKKREHESLVELESVVGQNLGSGIFSAEDKIDESVYNQIKQINSISRSETPLVCKDLSKKYQNFSGDKDYIALKPLSLSIPQNSILGLLGPNGAGKTTLISVLTGMYPQTSGDAWIKGLPVGYSSTNRFIGVCPQFDLLWPNLSVYQHLRFYCLLKGVPSESISRFIDEYITDFDLEEWRDTPSKHLSGGMKRRLSIANGLVGNPSIVFLDQPSSGLDPNHRRQLWNILLKCAKKTSILLTTHMMEEAQVLCDRVGIIDHGNLKCIGKIHDLKERFGRGYRLNLNFSELEAKQKKQLIQIMKSKLNVTVLNELTTRVILKIQKSQLMNSIEILKEYKTVTWQITQPSLYDVFVDFVN